MRFVSATVVNIWLRFVNLVFFFAVSSTLVTPSRCICNAFKYSICHRFRPLQNCKLKKNLFVAVSLGFLKFKLTICKGDLLTDLVNLSVQTHQRGQYHYANLTNVVNLTVHWLLRQVVGQMGSGFASQAHLNPVIVSVYLYVWHTLCICIFVCMCICICICSCICICVCGYCQTIVKQSYSRLTTRQWSLVSWYLQSGRSPPCENDS